MKNVLGVLLASIFAVLSLLHIYWAFGGLSGGSVAIPSVDNAPLFVPSRSSTLAVAAALFLGMMTILGQIGWLAS